MARVRDPSAVRGMAMDERLENERQFHNTAFTTDQRSAALKYYRVVGRSRDRYIKLIEQLGQGRRVLEYGCATGSYVFHLANRGARVTGIDISDGALEEARRSAPQLLNPGAEAEFKQMNAEALEFPDATFDLVCGTGILHHLDLAKSYSELRRVLKPDGAAVFVEPMAHNPLIALYRWATPSMRTPDEHPLLVSDLKMAEKYFGEVQSEFFHLLSLAAVPFSKTPVFGPVLSALERTDDLLFDTAQSMRRFAWRVVLVLRKPKQGSA
ncbi:MAG TPA: class I SAM-dependent methyltransferase [Myxococcales bacterium]|nr:class I SAM-dependent methyltransferase [Myxococcales bacterium]